MSANFLMPPRGRVDVVLDTDAYNEVDDQYAIAYLLRSVEKLNTCAIYAAPFLNVRSETPADGMEKSYDEICHVLSLMGEDVPVFRGSMDFLKNEGRPVVSPAALDLIDRASTYSRERPLYVVAIGAITNVASALLMAPEIRDKIVVVWLGGHAYHYHDTREFNMREDIAAARVVMQSGVSFVQLPCRGVVDLFALSRQDMLHYFGGKNELCDYLLSHSIEQLDEELHTVEWSKPLWDVTAIAWLLFGDGRTIATREEALRLPDYEGGYEPPQEEKRIGYVYHLRRDEILRDLVKKLTR